MPQTGLRAGLNFGLGPARVPVATGGTASDTQIVLQNGVRWVIVGTDGE